ncbi:MAG: SDR family oxidoreductase [Actinomycetia bacterium]|nr:SDR family oxidoreductase [Actinomycetes bacterium]
MDSQQRVLVTGASSGIGRATTQRLVEQGAKVVGVARRTEKILATGALALRLDVTDSDACGQVVDTAARELGGLDAVVNAAGLTRPGSVRHGNPADWAEMFAVNVTGLLAICQAAIPYLVRSGHGQIINISSMSGHRVLSPRNTVYAATKHAVEAISKGLRKELRDEGVRVTSVAPGYVRDTEIHHSPASPRPGFPAVSTQADRDAAAATGLGLAEFTDLIISILQLPAGVQVQRLEVTSDLQAE